MSSTVTELQNRKKYFTSIVGQWVFQSLRNFNMIYDVCP